MHQLIFLSYRIAKNAVLEWMEVMADGNEVD